MHQDPRPLLIFLGALFVIWQYGIYRFNRMRRTRYIIYRNINKKK